MITNYTILDYITAFPSLSVLHGISSEGHYQIKEQ